MNVANVTAKPVIAVVGAASVDMTLRDPPSDWIGSTGHDAYTSANLHLLRQRPDVGLGGNGAAAAYVLARLGLAVHLYAPIGDDPLGQLVRGWLEGAGVTCVTPTAPGTMVSLCAVNNAGERLGTLQHASAPVEWAVSGHDRDAEWLLVALHAQVSPDEFAAVDQALAGFGGKTLLDTGIGWMGNVTRQNVHGLWSKTDLVSGALEEWRYWTQLERPEAIAEHVLAAGAQCVVIKMGAQGAAFHACDGRFVHQPATRVSRRDLSIGAGDTFNGALVGELAVGRPFKEAVASAQRAAAAVVATGRGVLGWAEMGDQS